MVIAQGFGEGLGFLQVDVDPLELAQRKERTTQVEAEINGLRLRIRMRGEPVQRAQRLLEVGHRLAVRRVGEGIGPGLAAVGHGLVPHLTTQGMVRQSVDLLGQPVGIQLLQGRHNAGVQHPPPLLEETAVGHLVGEGVLEGVLPLGEQARLVEELGPLELRQTAVQRLL